MAFALVNYTGDATTTDFSFSFGFLQTSHIEVRLATVLKVEGVDYTINTVSSEVEFTVAPGLNVAIEILRVTTDRTEANIPIIFTSGAAFRAADFNSAVLYLLYIVQELLDGNASLTGIGFKDEDDLVSDSDVHVPSQQSVKAYVDATTGLGNVVEDLTPQLGGDLDVNGSDIVSVSNADINITPNGTGTVVVGTDLDVDNINIDANNIKSTDTNGAINLVPDGTGSVVVQSAIQIDSAIDITNNSISSLGTNANINLTPNGTGTVVVNTDLDVDNINIDGNSIISTDTNGNISIIPDGTGAITLDFMELPIADGTSGQALKTDGAGNLDWTTFSTGGLGNIVEDTSPQLGADLDANAFDIQFDDVTGIRDSNDNETLLFGETASAVNYLKLSNAAAAGDVTLETVGDDTDVDLAITPQADGKIVLDGLNWPIADGTANQVIETDGAGQLSFVTSASTAGLVKISTQSASSSATIDFTGLTATYSAYKVILTGYAPATDNTQLWIRTSTDGGSTYDSGSGDYAWGYNSHELDVTPVSSITGDPTDPKIVIAAAIGNATNEGGAAEITIFEPSATTHTRILAESLMEHADGKYFRTDAGGVRASAADVDAIRFLSSSGNIATGVFTLYGIIA